MTNPLAPTSENPNGEWGWQWLAAAPLFLLYALSIPLRWAWRKLRGAL